MSIFDIEAHKLCNEGHIHEFGGFLRTSLKTTGSGWVH